MKSIYEDKELKLLVKKEAKTSDKFGKNPGDRTVKELLDTGIININKFSGPTSHQVSAYVKEILKLKKAGHSGTLDPKVTGVLPVAISRATKVLQTFLPAGKEYVCIMHIHKEVSNEQLDAVFKKFIGKIKQLPPLKSAVKRQWRFREIYYLKLLEQDKQDVLFRVGCEAGTYIRKLVHDIGQDLGCGAHMAQLIRTKAGPFTDKDMYSLQDLADAFHYYNEGNEKYIMKIVKPIDYSLPHVLRVYVLDTTVDTICHGATLKIPGLSKIQEGIGKDDTVAIFTLKDELIALGTALMCSKDMMRKNRGIAIKTSKVFMPTGTYPKVEKVY
jgi:H/ACA ribonucleoprotein complex subunit 4